MKRRILSVCTVMLLMLTMLCACGQKTDDAMIGTWTCEKDFASYLNEGLATEPEVAEYMAVDSFILKIELTLNADGTYKMSADNDVNKAAFDSVKQKLSDGMTAYLSDAAAEYDMTLDDLLDATDTTVEDLIDEVFGDDMYEALVDEMEAEGKYQAKDGKIWMSEGLNYDIDEDEYETYTLSGNTLTITGDSDGTTDGVYPMEFKK